MLVKEFEGKTEKDALKNALEELGLAEEQIRVEVLDKGKRSILGLGESVPAKIRVYYEEISTVIKELEEIVATTIKYMGIEAEVEAVEEGDKRIYINVSSEDSAILIGKKGVTLDAIQFVTSLAASRLFDVDEEYHVLVDIEGYRKRREESLKDMAKRTASTVKKTKRPKVLEPMNPYERRVVHLALQDDKDIETKSEGEGNTRRIKVLPKRSGGGYKRGGTSRGYRR